MLYYFAEQNIFDFWIEVAESRLGIRLNILPSS